LSLEKLEEKILQWKKEYSIQELRSIVNFFKNPVNKLIAEKLLLSQDQEEFKIKKPKPRS